MEKFKEYIGVVLPFEKATEVWNIVSQIEGYFKSITFVEGGCIIDVH